MEKHNPEQWLVKMGQAERFNEIRKLVLKISVITGWQLPQKEIFQILIDQLDKFLIENYPYFTADEIEYGFRRYGTQIKDFGREVNLSLFNEVLALYKADRRDTLIQAQNEAKNSLKTYLLTDSDIRNERRGEIQFFYKEIQRGNWKAKFYPYFVDVLKQDGFNIDEEKPMEFFENCLKNKIPFLYENKTTS